MIQIKRGHQNYRQKQRMAFKRAFNNEVVRTAAFVLSIALMAWIVFSVW